MKYQGCKDFGLVNSQILKKSRIRRIDRALFSRFILHARKDEPKLRTP